MRLYGDGDARNESPVDNINSCESVEDGATPNARSRCGREVDIINLCESMEDRLCESLDWGTLNKRPC